MMMMMMPLPIGFRFNPTDEELIQLLQRKDSSYQMPIHSHFIPEKDVYELDPKHLQWDHNVALSNNERFYYCLKDNDSREVSGKGWWRATGHIKKIYAHDDIKSQPLVGYKRPLTFHRFRDLDSSNNKRKRNKAIKTNWIMHEYSLESHTTDWRLCKIKFKGKPSVQEELENIRKIGTSMLAEAEKQKQQPDFVVQQQQRQTDFVVEQQQRQTDFVAEQQQRQPDFVAEQQQQQQRQPDFVAEQQQQQQLQQPDFVAEQQQQTQRLELEYQQNQQYYSFQLDNNLYEPYHNILESIQMEAINVEQQQPSKSDLYDPYYDCNFDNVQLELPTHSSEQVLPGLWSWQN